MFAHSQKGWGGMGPQNTAAAPESSPPAPPPEPRPRRVEERLGRWMQQESHVHRKDEGTGCRQRVGVRSARCLDQDPAFALQLPPLRGHAQPLATLSIATKTGHKPRPTPPRPSAWKLACCVIAARRKWVLQSPGTPEVAACSGLGRLAMGCDGGTIPKRHELVKGPKKVEKVSYMGPVGPGGGAACERSQETKGGGRRS